MWGEKWRQQAKWWHGSLLALSQPSLCDLSLSSPRLSPPCSSCSLLSFPSPPPSSFSEGNLCCPSGPVWLGTGSPRCLGPRGRPPSGLLLSGMLTLPDLHLRVIFCLMCYLSLDIFLSSSLLLRSREDSIPVRGRSWSACPPKRAPEVWPSSTD